jgi:hypothetical protein
MKAMTFAAITRFAPDNVAPNRTQVCTLERRRLRSLALSKTAGAADR